MSISMIDGGVKVCVAGCGYGVRYGELWRIDHHGGGGGGGSGGDLW